MASADGKYLCSISAGAAHGNCLFSSFDSQTNKNKQRPKKKNWISEQKAYKLTNISKQAKKLIVIKLKCKLLNEYRKSAPGPKRLNS